MFPECFLLVEAIVASVLAVLLANKYIQHRRNNHLVWAVALIFWSTFELGGFLHFIYGSTPITGKIVTLLHMPIMALYGVGMLFLFQGFEIFPKVTVPKTLPKYFLVYTLIVYSVLIGTVLAADVQQAVNVSSWALLIIPGAIITVSGSISGFFLGRKTSILITIGLFLSIIAEQLWHMGLPLWTLDTVSETLMGLGFLIAIEPPLQKGMKNKRSFPFDC
jgi:predicted neutral ceramidase superfamily lipid hydrolase